jgi:hypothetical protein
LVFSFFFNTVLEGVGTGSNDSSAESEAAKSILFELVTCDTMYHELIKQEEEKVKEVILALKVLAKLDTNAPISDATTECNLIAMNLFSTKVEFEMFEGLRSEFHNCQAIIQYKNIHFPKVQGLIGQGYGRSQRENQNHSTFRNCKKECFD